MRRLKMDETTETPATQLSVSTLLHHLHTPHPPVHHLERVRLGAAGHLSSGALPSPALLQLLHLPRCTEETRSAPSCWTPAPTRSRRDTQAKVCPAYTLSPRCPISRSLLTLPCLPSLSLCPLPPPRHSQGRLLLSLYTGPTHCCPYLRPLLARSLSSSLYSVPV